MKKVLFIINGMTKSNWKVGISWGDIRLFEIMKNLDWVEKILLTTPNWLSVADKLWSKIYYRLWSYSLNSIKSLDFNQISFFIL